MPGPARSRRATGTSCRRAVPCRVPEGGLSSPLAAGSVISLTAGWSSLVARRAHNPKVVGSNPTPATNERPGQRPFLAQQEGPLAMSMYQGCTTPVGQFARGWSASVRALSPVAVRPSVGGHGSGCQRSSGPAAELLLDIDGLGGASGRDGSVRAPAGGGAPRSVPEDRAAGPLRPGRGGGLDRGQPGGAGAGVRSACRVGVADVAATRRAADHLRWLIVQRRVTKAGEVRWDVRYRDDARQQRKRSFERKLDAQRFARSVETDLLRGDWIDPRRGRELFEMWAAMWMETLAAANPRRARATSRSSIATCCHAFGDTDRVDRLSVCARLRERTTLRRPRSRPGRGY